MSPPDPVAAEVFRYVLADSIAILNVSDWDRVSARSGLFLSRRFLGLLEQNRPENLTMHYALAYAADRPVAAIVAQSLDIRLVDLSSSRAKEGGQGFWRSLEKATVRSIIVLERLDPEQVKARAPEIYGLYLQVHEHQRMRLVTFGSQWIPALAATFGDDFRTVIARRKEGSKLLGFVNIIRDGDRAHGYYIGFDKATAAKGVPLYLGLVYAGVGQAIEMGAKQMSLGRTALAPKAQLGARAQPMYGYIRHRNAALNLAVPSILALLPAPDEPPERHPFKSAIQLQLERSI